MVKIRSFLIAILSSVFLASCMFTEEIFVNNNGSGKYVFTMDMGEMMESVKGMSTKDSLKEPEVIDTIILFKDLLKERKDSIKRLSAEEKASLKAIEDLTLHMRIDEEKGEMIMDFGLDFKNIAELKNMQDKITKAQALNENKDRNSGLKSKADIDYAFENGLFSRKVIMKDLSEEQLQEVEQSIKQSSSFLEGSRYQLIYHFESQIDYVTFKGAVLSEDRKTMTINVPMDSVIMSPKWLDFEVKLRK